RLVIEHVIVDYCNLDSMPKDGRGNAMAKDNTALEAPGTRGRAVCISAERCGCGTRLKFARLLAEAAWIPTVGSASRERWFLFESSGWLCSGEGHRIRTPLAPPKNWPRCELRIPRIDVAADPRGRGGRRGAWYSNPILPLTRSREAR